jgi:hypothetical protein
MENGGICRELVRIWKETVVACFRSYPRICILGLRKITKSSHDFPSQIRTPWCETDRSLPSVTEVNCGGALPPLLMLWCLIKHMDNFT